MDKVKIGQIISIVIVAIVALLGLFFPLNVGVAPIDVSSRSATITQFQRVYVAHDLAVGGDLSYSTGTYPLGITTAGQNIICGTTAVFTGSTSIASTLTTPAYALVTQVTAPLTATAFTLYASDPTTTTVTITSLNVAGGAGTTGVSAHYCIVGTK
jgi:hypothetical protein